MDHRPFSEWQLIRCLLHEQYFPAWLPQGISALGHRVFVYAYCNFSLSFPILGGILKA